MPNSVLIAQRMFNRSNLLVVNAVVEVSDESIKDRVYFEFYKGYDRQNGIKMALNITDVRAMIYAIKEVVKKGSTGWKKFTQKKNDSNKKTLTLTREYINASYNNLQIGIQVNSLYEYMAIADDLTGLANELERALFRYQRERGQQ